MSYEILSTLPEGATSRTWLALRDGRRRVVLREVREGIEPFLPESTPEAVLPLVEVWEAQNARYAVYDYAPGVSLRELVEALREQDRPVPLGIVGRIIVDAARAMGEVHAKHPPLPPHGGLSDAALLIGFDGVVRVLDYGVPRPSRFQPSVSSRPHGDVFALGAVLHSVLTGFAGSYADAVDEALPLPPPTHFHDEATPALDDVLARATARAFARRQVDAGSLADELEAVLGDALFTRAQVAEVVGALFSQRASAAARAVQIEPDEASLSDADSAPTGAHQAPWLRTDSTSPALVPVLDRRAQKTPAVLWVTGMTLDTLPAPERPAPVASEEGALEGTAPRAVRHPALEPVAAVGSDQEGTVPHARLPGGADTTEDDDAAPLAPAPGELRSRLPPGAKTGFDGDAPADGPSPGPRPRLSSGHRPASVQAPPSRSAAELPATVEDDVPASEARDTSDEGAPPPLVEPEPTRPRVHVPISAQDTHPRAPGVANLDTTPRASAPRPRNTTDYERRKARGQERIATPPLGVPAVSPDDAATPGADELGHGIGDEPTDVRSRRGAKKRRPPPPTGSEGELAATGDAEHPPNRARPGIAGLLLLLALGLGAVAVFAPQKFLALRVKLGLAKAPQPEPDEAPLEAPGEDVGDAGEVATAGEDGGAAAAVALAGDADGGGDDDEGDAGAVELTDAGATDAPVPDGGALQDGGTTKPGAKSPPKKKKKKRRRRR